MSRHFKRETLSLVLPRHSYQSFEGSVRAMMTSTVKVSHSFRTLSTPEEFPGCERVRLGLPADAKQVIAVLNHAFNGGLKYFWKQRAVEDENPVNVAIRDVESNHGYLSWRNMIVIELNEKICGCLFGLNEVQQAWESGDPNLSHEENALHAVEYRAHTLTGSAEDSHTWYIPFIAVDPTCQGRGLGTILLNCAAREAKARGRKQMSLVVPDDSMGAYNLYKNKFGFQEIERVPVVKGNWGMPADKWITMRKPM